MKALFINATIADPIGIYPKEGEVLTVSQCPYYPNNYDVLEYPVAKDGKKQSFGKFRFIPLSSIDETEFIRESITIKI